MQIEKQLKVKRSSKRYVTDIGVLKIYTANIGGYERLALYELRVNDTPTITSNDLSALDKFFKTVKNQIDKLPHNDNVKMAVFVNDTASFYFLAKNSLDFSEKTRVALSDELYQINSNYRVEFRPLNGWTYDKLRSYSCIAAIPYTLTSDVKRQLRRLTEEHKAEWKGYIGNQIDDLTVDSYTDLRQTMNAGNNDIAEVGIEYKNARCFDIKSSYPFVQATMKFPSGNVKIINNPSDLQKKKILSSNRPYILCGTVRNLTLKGNFNMFRPSFLREAYNINSNARKVFSVQRADINLTDIDLKIFTENYDFSYFKINKIIVFSRYAYLPKFFRDYIIEAFLKKEKDPALKAGVNCLWGFAMQRIIGDLTEENLKKQNKYSFLPMSFGLWTLSYARRELYRVVSNVEPLKYHTDSIAFVESKANMKLIDTENARKRKLISELYDPEKLISKGTMLGQWKDEYKEPVTLKVFSPVQYVVKGEHTSVIKMSGCQEEALNALQDVINVLDINIGTIIQNAKRVLTRHENIKYRNYVVGGTYNEILQ